MASYSNPWAKGKPINTSGRILAQGIARMAGGFAKDHAAKKAKQQRDADEAQGLLDGRTKAFEKNLWTGYDSLQNDLSEFESGMSAENRDQFQKQVVNMLKGMRDETSQWIQDNPEASDTDIRLKQAEALKGLDQFKKDLTHLNAAREEYLAARDIPLGEEGSLVSSFNPQLIKMFEAIERNDPNVHLTRDDGGGFRISVVDEEQLGNALGGMKENDLLEFTSASLTKMGEKAEAGDGYFMTVEEPDYSSFTEMIDNDKTGQFWTKGKDGEKIYNKEAIEEYYTTGDGQAILTSFADDEDAMGNWIGYGQDIINPDGSETLTSWSNTTANYDPNKYLTSHLQGFINSLPGTKPQPTTTTKTKSNKNNNISTPPPSSSKPSTSGGSGKGQAPVSREDAKKHAISKGWFDPKKGFTKDGRKKYDAYLKSKTEFNKSSIL
jgi:hypothetical protein